MCHILFTFFSLCTFGLKSLEPSKRFKKRLQSNPRSCFPHNRTVLVGVCVTPPHSLIQKGLEAVIQNQVLTAPQIAENSWHVSNVPNIQAISQNPPLQVLVGDLLGGRHLGGRHMGRHQEIVCFARTPTTDKGLIVFVSLVLLAAGSQKDEWPQLDS